MRKLVLEGKKNPSVRQLAIKLTGGLKQKDRMGEIEAVFIFVRDRIRFVRDINGVETLHEAQQVLRQGAGDCDDKAILLASMLESIGYETRFRAIGFRPNFFSHVLVQARIHKGAPWIWLETTHPVPMGWKPPGIMAVMTRHNRRS